MKWRTMTLPVVALGLMARLSAQAVPQLTVTRDLTIDGKTAGLEVSVRLRVGPNGTMAIANPMDTRLVLVDSNKKRVQVLGTRGDGPGAINTVQFFGWVSDSLWVVDPSLKRMTFFTPNRAVARTMPLPLTIDGPPGTAVADHSSMSMIIVAAYPGGDMLTNEYFLNKVLNKGGGLSYLLRNNAEGSYKGAMGPTISPSTECMVPDTTMTFILYREFCMGPQTAVAANGRYAVTARTRVGGADSSRYVVTQVNERGDTVYNRSYPFVGIPVTPHELDSAVARMIDLAHKVSRPMNDAGFKRLDARIREVSPSVRTPLLNPVLAGDDGTVWLSLSSTEPGKHWLELDARGNPVGTFSLPASVMLLQAEHGTVWGREILPDSTVNIVRYRVSGGKIP